MVVRCIFCVLSSMVAMTLMISLTHGQEPAVSSTDQPLVPPSSATSIGSKASTKTKIVYKEKSYYDFEDVLINGNVRAPDGSFIFRKNDSNFSSALNLKRSFIPELKESSASAR